VTDHRPLILLDVDGPLNPWKAKPTRRPAGYETFRMFPSGWRGRKGLRVWLNPRHGDLLGALADVTGGELVWATTWLEQANTLIGPEVGLPELPVVHWGVVDAHRWKFSGVLDYAGSRPLVWFDDDFDVHDNARRWFLEQRGAAHTLLRHVDPRVGLTFDDVSDARDFLLRATEDETGER